MSDLFYDTLVLLGRHPFWVSSTPVVVGAHHTARPGGYLLAANHTSPYDIPVLMRHTRRRVDFLSITEVFENPFVGALYGAMNAFPLDRSRPDVATTKTAVDRLRAGRVVGMFPEGGFRAGPASILHGGRIRPGIGRLAALAGVPIVPCAILGAEKYRKASAWLPLRRTRYAVAFGPPLSATGREPQALEQDLIAAIASLGARLSNELYGGQAAPPTQQRPGI